MLDVKKLLTKILEVIKPVTPYAIRTVTSTMNISARAGATFTFSIPSISGYTAVGYVRWSNNHGNSVYITSMSYLGAIYAYNSASSAQSTTIDADVLYIKTTLLGGVLLKSIPSMRKGVLLCLT